ncbi:MAG: hypothetical protein JW902_15035, partial [Syntrophaceae bacterium]|nr:hypothetical protein [Syntrophaceae bacterium]
MASDNARRFEVRLHKLGLFMLVCSISCLSFAAFLFGVVVGSDLEGYPEKISRQVPARFLAWVGLLEPEKPKTLAVVIKREKTVRGAEVKASEAVASNVIPPSVPSVKEQDPNVKAAPPESKKVKKLSAAAVPEKDKA